MSFNIKAFAVILGITLISCKKGPFETELEGVVWNPATKSTLTNIELELIDSNKNELIEVLAVNNGGNFKSTTVLYADRTYELRFRESDYNYDWYALSLSTKVDVGVSSVITIQNYRYGWMDFDIYHSLNVYDSVNVQETHLNLGTVYSDTHIADSSASWLRAEGPWEYQITYYRDTVDSVVTYEAELFRATVSNFPIGSNKLEIHL